MATVEGTFLIIDRASAPMRRMERQAQQTDRAIRQLGMSTDGIGNEKQIRQLNNLDRGLRTFARDAETNDRVLRRHSRTLDEHVSRWDKFRDAVTRTGAAIAGIGRIFSAAKIPAMGVAMGIAAQAVGALAGGVIALLPRIADLGGAIFALGPIMAGLGGSMIAVKFAFGDLTKAMAGNEKALKSLTPEARRFMNTLKEYQPVIKELRESAQRGLFPGLADAVGRLQRGVPVANQLLQGFGRTVGNLARLASERFTTQGFLADLLGIGRAGQRATSRLGEALLNIADAFRQLTAAAIPFTDWLTRMVLRASEFIDRWATFQRDSGRFQAMLERTQRSLIQFGHILRDLYTWFRALGRAARPLGDTLWGNAERAVRAWSRWANSIQGQIRLTRTFAAMGPAVQEIAKILTDLVRVIFRMGTGQLLPGIARTLRNMIPDLEKLLNLFVTTFGPQAAQLIQELVRTLTFLVGTTGPINILLTLVTRVLKLFNDLIDAVPGLNRVLTAAFSVALIGLFIGRLRGVASAWWSVVTGARAAQVAQAQALAMGGAPGMTLPVRGRGVSTAAGVAGEAATVGGIGAWLARRRGGAAVVRGAERAGLGRLLGGGVLSAGAARGVLGAAGRFLWPIAAIGGVYGGVTAQREGGARQQIEQTIMGTLSGATMGLIPAMTTPSQRADRRVQQLMGGGYTTGGYGGRAGLLRGGGAQFGLLGRATGIGGQPAPERHVAGLQEVLARQGGATPTTLRQVEAQIRTYRQFARRIGSLGTESAKQAADSLRQQVQVLRQAEANVKRQQAESARGRAYQLIRQEGRAFDIYAGRFGMREATTRTTADVEQRLRRLPEAGRRILAQQYLSWIREQSKAHPQMRSGAERFEKDLVRIYQRAGTNIRIVHGQIVDDTKKQWQAITRVMTTNAAEAARQTGQQFTAIQQKAVGALQAMGVSKQMAVGLVRGIETGKITPGAARSLATGTGGGIAGVGNVVTAATALSLASGGGRRATGGRISAPGYDMSDRVTALVGKGELVVNRHTERKIDHMLGGMATLGSMVAREGTPHSFKRGGRVGGVASPSGPATGGLQPGIASIAGEVTGQFPGLSITSTTGGRHAKNSYHYRGMAVDIGGAPSLMFQAAQWIGQNIGTALLEGIHNPNLSVKNGRTVAPDFWGAQTWAGHRDHIHLAAGGGGARGAVGGFMAGRPGGIGQVRFGQIAPGTTGIPGIPGLLADTAGTLMAAGFTRAINQNLRGLGRGGMTVAGGGGGSNRALGKRMMLAHGWGPGEWGALERLWTGESGWRTTAANPSSGAYGIPQSLPGSKMASVAADWKTNPATQIKWGLDYIAGRYGSPSQAYAQWLGRSPHWYGDGGAFRARRPMVIGVGDRDEDVQITPRQGRTTAGRAGRPVTLKVEVGAIHHHGKGDTAGALEAEFQELARRLTDLPLEDDNEVLA
jgi:hypothetical protein